MIFRLSAINLPKVLKRSRDLGILPINRARVGKTARSGAEALVSTDPAISPLFCEYCGNWGHQEKDCPLHEQERNQKGL